MSTLELHFRDRAAELADVSSLVVGEADAARTLRLVPYETSAATVVLYLARGDVGTVSLDDPACVPAEIGEDLKQDLGAIDYFVDVARDGAVVAFRMQRGGCTEITKDGILTRTWMSAMPFPGWRRRAERVDYAPYRMDDRGGSTPPGDVDPPR